MTRKIKVRNISVSKSKTVNNRCQLALNNEFLATSKDWVSHANNLIEISVKITSKEIIITPRRGGVLNLPCGKGEAEF